MDRVIFHCDLNSFYASVELLDHPELRHLPVAVCGDPESRHGIILAKNEPAKAFGVKTAETIWQARRKCPGPGASPRPPRQVPGLLPPGQRRSTSEYTDLVEPFGIDESWLDVTGTLHLFGGDPSGPGRPAAGADAGGAGADHLGGGVLQQGVCQAGQRLQKARRHHRHYPGKFPAAALAPAGDGPALCGGRASGPDAGGAPHPYHWGPGPRPPGGPEEMAGQTREASSTTRPMAGTDTALSARRERPRLPSPWETASPSAGI